MLFDILEVLRGVAWLLGVEWLQRQNVAATGSVVVFHTSANQQCGCYRKDADCSLHMPWFSIEILTPNEGSVAQKG